MRLDDAVSAPANPFQDFHARYGPAAGEPGPERFVREQFKAEPDPWQVDGLRAFGRGERKISIVACHNPGKTAFMSWCAIIQILTRFPQKTVVTAPTGSQLFDAFFTEFKIWLGKLPPELQALVEVKSDIIELCATKDTRKDSFISIRTARPENPEAMQGVHREDGYVLLLVDEGSGVHDRIYESGKGSMAGKRVTTIISSNPVKSTGYFHGTQTAFTGWHRIHITGDPDDELGPGSYFSGRVNPEFVKDIIDEYGKDSNAYRVRVQGLFPRADDDTIIPFEAVEQSLVRDVRPNLYAPIVWGVDVGISGDLSALAKRRGHELLEPIKTKADLNDTMLVVGWVKSEWDATPTEERPEDICVDFLGIGAGVAHRLREMGLPARAINVAENPALNGERFRNLRTELWYSARDWFMSRECRMPRDKYLERELTAQRYKIIDSSGKVWALPKSEMRKVIRRSPDRADAFMLTFASTATSALHGRPKWNAPLKRGIKGIV